MTEPDKYKIMVADDDDSVRESLGKSLQKEGYRVILAANGSQAVDLFREDPDSADLLLIDLNMPPRNGWVALNQLLEMNSSLPVFVITGLSHQDVLAETSGVRALIEKPINVPELLDLIQKQLSDPGHSTSGRRIAFRHVPAGGFNKFRQPFARPSGSYDHWGLNE